MKHRVRIGAVGLLLIIIGGLLMLKWCGGSPDRGRECVFTVRRGWGVRRIAGALADSGLVRCDTYFLWRYSRMEGSQSILAGDYMLDDSMSPDSILSLFIGGDVIPVETNWVTLAPGLTIEQSMEVLSSDLGIPPWHLDSLATDTAFLSSLEIPALEGYIFPETYEFADSLEPAEILIRIVETGRSRWPSDIDILMEGTELTLHETIILASIVEREAKVDPERAIIAGVFLSRLRIGMNLESCATVQYALGEVRETLLYSDLEVESPYNTYRNQGLPPGPICSPGEVSIYASFHPDLQERYLYFVSIDDGTGRHLFATTHAGHLANQRSIPDR